MQNIPLPEALPTNISGNKFIALLEKCGLEYIDNRASGGIIWVIDLPAQREKLKLLFSTIDGKLEKRGAIATKSRPAWMIRIK